MMFRRQQPCPPYGYMQSVGRAEPLEHLEELIEQSRRNHEEILRLVISVQANQIDILQHQVEMAYQMTAHANQPRRFGWGGLALAGLAGYWLGGGFDGDD